MRNFFFLLLLPTISFAGRPEWIEEPIKLCPRDQICGLGSGKTLERATSVAREELAKVLKVKVSGKTSVSTYSSQKREKEFVEGSVRENLSKNIEEVTEEILEGTFVKETYIDNGEYFVFAGLDKNKTGQIIKKKILSIDQEIEHLFNLGRRASLFEAIKIFPIREELDARYEYITSQKIPTPITLKDLYLKKEKYFKKQTKLFLKFFGFPEEGNLKSFIISQLLDLGFVQVINPKEDYNYEIKLFYNFNKNHLNVEGFEKHQFNFKAFSFNRNKIKIGTLSFSVDGSGRSFAQARKNAEAEIKEYLINNLNKMNLD